MEKLVKACKKKQGLNLPSWFVDVQEAIPAASSTAKPQAEEVASQGTASEPLAQECLGEENQTENIGKKTQRGSEEGKRHTYDCIWTDGMAVMKRSLIVVSIVGSLRNFSVQMEQL